MADTIIESLRDYFLTCPLMGNCKINVDLLPESGMEYSIDPEQAAEILKKFVNGDTQRQYLFMIRSVNSYGSDVLQNMANSGFFEKFSAWLEKQTNLEKLPDLPIGKSPELIEAQSTGFLFKTSPNSGKYQIQCRLIYLQRG